MEKVLIIIGLLVSTVGYAFAQAEQSGLVKTKDGILVVSNEPGNYYTLEIKGNDIKPNPDHQYWFTVDGKFFQIVSVAKSEFMEPADKGLDDKAVLSAHMKWESDYVAKTLSSKLGNLASTWLILTSGKTAISWNYDMPHIADKQTARRQLYVLTVAGAYVIGVNTVVEKDGEEANLQKLLVETMNSLKPRDKPLPLEEASRQIRNGI